MAQKQKAQKQKKSSGKWLAAVAVLLLVGGVAWALRGDGVDPAIAALESQRAKAFSDTATDADRDAFREQIRALSDDQRQQFFQRSRPEMQARMTERMNALFALPPEQIQREARQRAADVVAARKQRENRPDDGRGGPPWGGGDQMTEAQRDQRRKERLDYIDPSARGQMSEFRRLVDSELKAMGQEPLSGRDMRAMMGGGRGGRGRG